MQTCSQVDKQAVGTGVGDKGGGTGSQINRHDEVTLEIGLCVCMSLSGLSSVKMSPLRNW